MWLVLVPDKSGANAEFSISNQVTWKLEDL